MACEESELRKGPWTLEEDSLLTHYIASHGEGRWNLLARCSGLKRTGKSCRLRWLNYLKPDVKRGNLTPEEQLLILELHSKWGNRWSKIAQYLPGRTDNEIKNYWRTRVQKQARQLKVDASSTKFRDAIRCFWMPRLLQQMQASEASESWKPIPTIADQVPAPYSSPDDKVQLSNADGSMGDCTPSHSSDSKKMAQFSEILQFPSSPTNAFDDIAWNPFLLKGSCSDADNDFQSFNMESAAAAGFDSLDSSMGESNWGLWDMDGLRLITDTLSWCDPNGGN